MTNFAPVLHRAIFALPQNSGEARRQIYICARLALRTLLEASEEADREALEKERLGLEAAILRVESEFDRRSDVVTLPAEEIRLIAEAEASRLNAEEAQRRAEADTATLRAEEALRQADAVAMKLIEEEVQRQFEAEAVRIHEEVIMGKTECGSGTQAEKNPDDQSTTTSKLKFESRG